VNLERVSEELRLKGQESGLMRSENEAMRAENTRMSELLAKSEARKGEVEGEIDSLKVEKGDVDKQLKDLKSSSQMNEAMLKFG
jgi:archaellum component FlaC